MALARVASFAQQRPHLVVDVGRDVPALPSRRRAFGVVGVICLAVAGLSTVLFAPRTSPTSQIGAGFAVTDARDAADTVTYTPGQQPAVLVFASSWSDSELVLRQVDEIVRQTQAQVDVSALALMVKDSPIRARAAVDAAAVSYQVGLDAGGQLAERYGVTRLPAVVTLDQQGLVVGRQQGIDDRSQVANLVQQLAQRTSRTTNGSN